MSIESHELSKKDKRIIRDLIEKGLQKEYRQGLQQFEAILQKWKNEQLDNRDTYHQLYKSVRTFDKHIAHRYDRMTGSLYLMILAAQIADELISEEDLTELSPGTQEAITHMIHR